MWGNDDTKLEDTLSLKSMDNITVAGEKVDIQQGYYNTGIINGELDQDLYKSVLCYNNTEPRHPGDGITYRSEN